MRSMHLPPAVLAIVWSLVGYTNLLAEVIRQQPGTDYLVVEAEAYTELQGDEFTGWLEVEPDGDLETVFGYQVLPADTNASGNAIFDQEGGGNFTDLASYELEFATPGTYFLYMRVSMFEHQTEDNYGNEDSVFLPLEFDALPEQAGWFSFPKLGHDDPLEDPPFWEGQFHWTEATEVREGDGEPLFLSEFEVSDADLGTALDFHISTRERGGAIDAMVFSLDEFLLPEDLDELLFDQPPVGEPGDFNGDGSLTSADVNALIDVIVAGTGDTAFDLNADGAFTESDLNVWVKDLKGTWIGDANLDLEFNSGDFVAVFTSGKFEIDADATWDEGDWTGDKRFNSGDFVAAFADGGFEVGPRAAVQSIPEPSAVALVLSAVCLLGGVRRRNHRVVKLA